MVIRTASSVGLAVTVGLGRAGLLGVAGRIAESEQVAGLDHPAQFRKPGKFWMKLVGVLTAAALGLTYASSALADDFTAPDTSSSTDSSVSSDSDTWAGQADGTLDTAPGDASDDAGTNDGSASTDTSNTQSDATTQPVAKPTGGCGDVRNWAILKTCVQSTAPAMVVIAQTIEVPANEIAVVASQITLTASDGLDPAMTSKENGDTIFNVAPGASLTIGTDVNDASFSYKNGKRFFAFLQGPKDSQDGGKLTVNNGTFSGIDTTDSKNHDMGTLVYNAGGTVTVKGGTFTGNKSTNGGVINQNSGSTIVTGGTFTGNMQEPANNCAEDWNVGWGDPCNATLSGSGGGAIHTDGGNLTIQGGVKFVGNSARAWGWNSGGGAVYATGTLRISNKIQAKATGGTEILTPNFTGNWAAVEKPWDESGNPIAVKRGGAGGAVFLQGTPGQSSTAYFMGGIYEDNASGYLGGGIYTEENTTSYVARSLATSNTAGHFGGGLWLCPSGSAQASEGGNIALYGNMVDTRVDANTDAADNTSNNPVNIPQMPEFAGTTTTAGADFAMMNPEFKNHNDTSFQLLDTWFTDRTTPAVEWHKDNTPLQHSSGYFDSWMPRLSNRQGIVALLARKDADNGAIVKKGTLVLSHKGTEGAIQTGVALKAKVIDSEQQGQAVASAQVSITGNRARLSGGGFGSNGVVLFSSPYSASWRKAAADQNGIVPTDKPTLLPGAIWKLTIKDNQITDKNMSGTDEKTPYMDEFLRTQACQAGNVTSGQSHCWEHDDTNEEWTAVIRDNGILDNNRTSGEIGVDNLAPGTYTLTEEQAPTGYQKTDTKYTFTITPVSNGTIPQDPDIHEQNENGGEGALVSGRTIGNKPMGGIAWTKRSSVNDDRLAGSTWKLEQVDHGAVTETKEVADCVSDTAVAPSKAVASTNPCDLDKDTSAGGFRLDGMGDGTYKLTETATPDGYWKPTNDEYWQVVLKDGNAQWTHHKGNEETSMATGDIVNTAMQVSWTKADSNDANGKSPLAGSTWTLTPEKGETPTKANVTDCVGNECTNVNVTPRHIQGHRPRGGQVHDRRPRHRHVHAPGVQCPRRIRQIGQAVHVHGQRDANRCQDQGQ